jgi:hypothetical protein
MRRLILPIALACGLASPAVADIPPTPPRPLPVPGPGPVPPGPPQPPDQRPDEPIQPAPRQPAAETCDELSSDASRYPGVPELLCLTQLAGNEGQLVLRYGAGAAETVRAHVLINRKSRCPGCNNDELVLAVPAYASVGLKVTWNGRTDVRTGAQSGTVNVGGKRLFYRRAGVPPVQPGKKP